MRIGRNQSANEKQEATSPSEPGFPTLAAALTTDHDRQSATPQSTLQSFSNLRAFSKPVTRLLAQLLVTQIALALALALVWQLKGTAGGGVAPEGSLRPFFGTSILAKAGAELHLIQAAVILVVLGLIYLAARLSRQTYVFYWAGAWFALFCYYSFALLRSLPQTDKFFSAYVELMGDAILFAASTVFILLAGLQLYSSRLSRRAAFQIGGSAVAVIFLQPLLGTLMGLAPLRSTLTVSNAAVACVVTIFAGFQLHQRVPHRWSIPGGLEVLPVFALYGLLQLSAPWLGYEPWNRTLYALALILKLPCALSVVAIALREVFGESEEAGSLLTEKNRALLASQHKLSLALTKAREAERAVGLRHQALEEFSNVLMQSREVSAAFTGLLCTTLNLLKCTTGFLVVDCPSNSPEERLLTLAAHIGVTPPPTFVGVRVPNPSAEGTSSSDSELSQSAQLDAVLREEYGRLLPGSAHLVSLRIGPPPLAWIIAVDPDLASATQPNLETLDDILQRLGIGLELVLFRELFALLESSRHELRTAETLQSQLEVLAKAAATCVEAGAAYIDLTDKSSGVRYRGFWPPTTASGAMIYDRKSGSPYPDQPRAAWRPLSASLAESAHPEYQSLLHQPISNSLGGVTGALIVIDKRYDQVGVAPFTPYDRRKLAIITDLAAAAVERETRQHNIELLVARNVHELRQSVAGLRNIMHWLQGAISPPKGTKLAKRLQDAATNVETLRRVVDAVDIYRERPRETPRPTKVFGDLIQKELAELRPRLKQLGFGREDYSLETSQIAIIPELTVVRSALHQIISNLVDNAVKYRDPRSKRFRLSFAADLDDRHYIIRIHDWGIGVPEEWSERIFLDGERAPNAVREVVTGMGLGLFLARRNAREMGGDLLLGRNRKPTEFALLIPKELRS